MGKKHADEMQIWTLEEFQKFIKEADKAEAHAAFNVLYYTGIRSGELLALTWKDIDFENKTIETTLNTYSHLYPNKQIELADKLQEILVSK